MLLRLMVFMFRQPTGAVSGGCCINHTLCRAMQHPRGKTATAPLTAPRGRLDPTPPDAAKPPEIDGCGGLRTYHEGCRIRHYGYLPN
jgi:hypothetical protein